MNKPSWIVTMVNIELNIHLLYDPNTSLDVESNSDLITTTNFYMKCSSDNNIFMIGLTMFILHNKTTLAKL